MPVKEDSKRKSTKSLTKLKKSQLNFVKEEENKNALMDESSLNVSALTSVRGGG